MSQPTLRQIFSEVVAQYSDLAGLLFTSFGFSPSFFESFVLPIAFDGLRRDTEQDIEVADDRLRGTDIAVLCDAGQVHDNDKRLSYELIPQRLDRALFHPKLIVAIGLDQKGTERADVVVGSANLTRAGWGMNSELALWRQLRPADQATRDMRALLRHWFPRGHEKRPKLKLFIDWFTQKRERVHAADVRLLSYPTTQQPLIAEVLDRLQNGGTLTACAPYLHGANALADLAGQHNFELRLVPGSDERGRFHLDKAAAISLAPRVVLRQWRGTSTEGRLNHSKLFLVQPTDGASYLIVGSHNLTARALGLPTDSSNAQRNAEVSLGFTPDNEQLADLEQLWKPLSADDFISRCPDQYEESAPEPAPVYCEVSLDWKARRLSVAEVCAGDYPPEQLRLHLPWFAALPLESTEQEFDETEAQQLADALRGRKGFKIKRGSEVLFMGTVAESNWQAARPEPLLDSNQILDAWYGDPGQERTVALGHIRKRRVQPSDGTEDDDEADLTNGKAPEDLFDSYFYFFRALRRKRQQLAEAHALSQDMHGMLFQRCTSIDGLIRSVEGDVIRDGATVRTLLFGWELEAMLAGLANRSAKLASKVTPLRERCARLVAESHARIESPARPPFSGLPRDKVLGWFRDEIVRLDGRGT